MPMRFAAMLLLALFASFALPASAWNRLHATRFATLPAGTALRKASPSILAPARSTSPIST